MPALAMKDHTPETTRGARGLECRKPAAEAAMNVLRSTIAVMLAALAIPASAQALSDAQLVDALRGGGYVLVFRHGATHADQADTEPLNVEMQGNEAKQRHLNDKGRDAARAWREA